MKRKKELLKVRGDETVFECAQTVLAALTLSQEGPNETTGAVTAVLRLPSDNAVLALWTIVTCFLGGFEEDETVLALRLIAETIAKHETTFNGAFPGRM